MNRPPIPSPDTPERLPSPESRRRCCRHCGQELAARDDFCPGCGKWQNREFSWLEISLRSLGALALLLTAVALCIGGSLIAIFGKNHSIGLGAVCFAGAGVCFWLARLLGK